MALPKCKTCDYCGFKTIGPARQMLRICQSKPPVVHPIMVQGVDDKGRPVQQMQMASVWPQVEENDACGDHSDFDEFPDDGDGIPASVIPIGTKSN